MDPDDEVDYRRLDAAFECSDPAVRLCAMRRLSAQLGVLLDTSLDSEWRTRIMRLRDGTDPVLAEAAHWVTEWRFGVPGVMTTSDEREQIAAAVHAALREDPSRLCAVAAIEPAYAAGGEKYLPSPVWHGVVLAMTEQPDLLERRDPAARRALTAVLGAQIREKQPAMDAVHVARQLSCEGAWDHVEDLSRPQDEWSWTALLQHDRGAVMDALQHSYMSGSTYPPAVVRHALATAEPGSCQPAFLALVCDPSIGTLDDAALREVVQRAGTSDPDLQQTVLMAWDSPGSVVRLGNANLHLGLLDRWLAVWRRQLHAMAEHSVRPLGGDRHGLCEELDGKGAQPKAANGTGQPVPSAVQREVLAGAESQGVSGEGVEVLPLADQIGVASGDIQPDRDGADQGRMVGRQGSEDAGFLQSAHRELGRDSHLAITAPPTAVPPAGSCCRGRCASARCSGNPRRQASSVTLASQAPPTTSTAARPHATA